MDRGQDSAAIQIEWNPVLARHPEVGSEQALGGGGAQADHHCRIDPNDLRLEPRTTRQDLGPIGLGVEPGLRTAPRLPFEVFDDIGDI